MARPSKTELKMYAVTQPAERCPHCEQFYAEHVDGRCPLAPYLTDRQRLDWLELVLREQSDVGLRTKDSRPSLIEVYTRESVAEGLGASLRSAIDRAVADHAKREARS